MGVTAALGRTRAILEPILDALRANSVKAYISTRRDQFLSPQFVWLEACLDQSLRPSDKQVFVALVGTANRIAGTEIDHELLAADTAASGNSLMEDWALAAKASSDTTASHLADLALRLIQSRAAWRTVVDEALSWFPEISGSTGGVVTDAEEDRAAWEAATPAIRAGKGGQLDLAVLLQSLALRQKEPPPDPNAVTLSTIHSAKGLEFNHVWLVGMAETVLPFLAKFTAERPTCGIGRGATKLLCSDHAGRGRHLFFQELRTIAVGARNRRAS